MAPTPQEHSVQINKEFVSGQLADDDVVITGMSGLFPTCSNVKEFAEKLYNNENMVKSDNRRWKYEHPELTEYCGNVPGLDKFDAQFFMVHFRLSNSMDAMSRKLLEHAYQAIFDAGISPQELSGKRVGVYIGTCLTETEKVCAYSHVGVGIVGCNRAMFSNRISYCLDLTGPSMTVDAACSGSMVSLEKAYQAMVRGDCEAAIVGASNIHLHPQSCIHYGRLLRLNADGKTKCFDKYADGQSPAECISIIFLQKAKDAKRVYATICNAKTEFSPLEDDHFDCYGPQRDPLVLSSFYNKFYKDAKISPSVVEYVEAYGSAFPEADKIELEAIEKVFCQNRDDPLYIGSVMSNIGYSQASTTVAAIVKVCIAYHTGKIAANLHCENPRDDIVALNEGRMRVVMKNKPFRRSYIGINSLSLTGINGHVLLRGEYKPKDVSQYESKIPYLLTVSGRQESAVEKIFDHLKSNQIDPEEIALFHNIHKTRVSKHLARGFVVLTPNEANEPVTIKEKVDYYDDAMRPLWFVYSGMGSQWNGMGTQLLRIPIFAAAIERCRKVLQPLGIDLMYILTSDDKTIYDNILHSFVGIAAVQIGLTDVLLQMGLVPDYIIGHSVGELGCAYADGCLTAEEMILSAYYRGLVSVQTPLIHGSLAAVGLGYQQIVTMCPPEIDVACHNSPESSTISGPSDVMREFVTKLMAQSIFAKEVPCSNIAYHSRYIKDAGPGLLEHLKDVIKNPKLRSKRWLSTSVPKERWNEPAAKLCSADYHTNNLLNPVLFEETAKAVPNNAVLIEVAPHGLLQAILKRYLPTTCTNVPLTRRGHSDNALFMLESLGDLYMTGYNPDLSILYPKIQFPVSTETRSLSHLMEWAHAEKWTLPVYVTADRAFAAAFDETLSTHDDEHSFLRGHIIDDDMVFPFAACLVFVWDTLAMSMEVTRRQVSVQFHDIHFHVQPELYDNRLLRLSVEIHRGTGKFEMHNDNVLLVSGYILEGTSHVAALYQQRSRSSTSSMEYHSNDIYRMFYDRGYGYRGDFRSIQEVNAGMTRALVSWKDNWVTFIDAAIQLNALRSNNDALEQPRFIHKLYVDVNKHKQALVLSSNEVEANIFEDQNLTRCGGVLMETITFMKKPPQVRQSIALKTLKFVPYQDTEQVEISAALNVFLQIVSENVGSDSITTLDITEGNKDSSLGRKIKEILPGLPDIKVSLKHINKHEVLAPNNKIVLPHLMLLDNLLEDNDISEVLHEAVPRDVFVIVLEKGTGSHASYRVMASTPTPDGRLVLARWRPLAVTTACSAVVTVTSEKDLLFLQDTRKNLLPDNSLVILTNYPPVERVTELVKRWRKDTKRNKIFVAMIDQDNSHVWQDKSLPELHLAFNVLRQGVWGGYYFVTSAGSMSNDPKPVALRSAQIGNLNSLHWVETIAPGPKDIAVSVHYAGLNFYDAKKATNEISLKHDMTSEFYGMDFSGLTDVGERVMGVVRGGAASSRVVAESSLLWPVPAHWTLEDAATVPLPYAHAFYCLGVKNKLQRGMSILIHGAAGALGQAALSVALAHGCQVFATVGDIRKKRFLRKMFPNLPEDNIGNSRDVTFGDMVLGATKGEGCSIIISCVKDSLKNVTLTCCATSGVTFDTHQIHSKENYAYGMYNMTRTRSYVSLDFSSIFTEEKFQEMEQLQLMISEGIAKGYVRPLSRVVYGAHEANRALRLLAASRHRGRALLKIHGEALPASPRLAVQPESSHLLLADSADNAVAVRMVDLLIARGATKIIAHLQQDPNTYADTYTQIKIKMWQKLGAEVKVSSENLKKTDKVEALIKECNKMGPLEGIYAVVADVNAASEAKMRVALENLDFASRPLSSLKHFAVIGKGSKFGVETCMNRVRNGLPAMVLQLPNIDKFTQCAEVADTTFVIKTSIGIRRAISAIETALCSSQPISLAFAQTRPEESLLEAISRISGVFIDPKSKDVSSLAHIGLSPEKYVEFIRILQKFNVQIPKAKALRMNLGELKATQKKLDDMKNKIVTGLEVLYSCVHENELLATADIVFIPTAAQKSTMRDDEFDCNATYLVMVPGMDGHHGKFELLCERLKLPVAVLQPGLDHPHETVSHMAERMVKVMLKKIKPKQNFYLLGYSFGVLVALEMAIILEERGLTGVVFCVDASPDTFPSALESLLGSSTGLQDAVVQHMYSLMVGDSSQHLADELKILNTWQDKVDAGIKSLRDKVPHSVQYARLMIEAAYARIEQARQYDVKKVRARPLSSQLVVLRSRHQPSGVPSDLGLSRYTQRVPHIYELAEDHAHALEDLRCANVVNRHLDQNILDIFHNKNLCVTYLLNASTYTQFSADYD